MLSEVLGSGQYLGPLIAFTAGERLSEKETEELMAWMRNALGSRVTNVKVRPT